MKNHTERRLERLEALRPGKPGHHVLYARDGQEDVALSAYRAATHPDDRAEMVVVVRRFSEIAA